MPVPSRYSIFPQLGGCPFVGLRFTYQENTLSSLNLWIKLVLSIPPHSPTHMSTDRATVRSPAVAGTFYPDSPAKLAAAVQQYIETADEFHFPPKALIAPHAGYIYSGPVAGTAYATVAGLRDQIQRVVLLGPAHRILFTGLAAPRVDAFCTPLGDIPLERSTLDELANRYNYVHLRDDAHALEHSLEVHLPFLQETLGAFQLLPLVIGQANGREVETVLEALWGGEETLVVISSDLSHYLDYEQARAIDLETAQAIEALDPTLIRADQACGRIPVSGLLRCARTHGLAVKRMDLRNSGDTAGTNDRVVGYGSWVLYAG